MKRSLLYVFCLCFGISIIFLSGCDSGENTETHLIEEQDTTNEHNSGEETQDTKKEKKTQKKSDSQPGDESKDEEFTNYIQFSLEERKDFVLQKIQHSLDTEIENNDKEKTTDTYSGQNFRENVVIIFPEEVVELFLCNKEEECESTFQFQNSENTLQEGDILVLFNEKVKENPFSQIIFVESFEESDENIHVIGKQGQIEDLFENSDFSSLGNNNPVNFDEITPFNDEDENDEEKREGEVKLDDNTFFHNSENASEQDAAKHYYEGLMKIIEPCETSILNTFHIIEEATFGVDFEEMIEGHKKTTQKLCKKSQTELTKIEPFRKDETITKALLEYFPIVLTYQDQEIFDNFINYVNLITKNGQKADINIDVMTGILHYETYQNLIEQFGLRKENLKDTGFIMDGENFFLNLSSGANNMEKALKKFNESVQKFAKRYNTTIEPHQFSLFTNQDFIGNITPISEKKNLTIVGQVSIEGDGTGENLSGKDENLVIGGEEKENEEKPTVFEGDIYDICGSYTFGKATMYSICLGDTKRKEITSKDIGNLTSLEGFSDFIALKIAYNGEEVENRSLIDKIFGDDLGKMTQDEFNEKFNFSKSKHLHNITYAGELNLSDLNEGETYKFTFDPLLEKTGKPNINNDLGKNVVVYTYSEGIIHGFQVSPYVSYHFPKISSYSFSNEDAQEIYLMYKGVSTRDILKLIDPESIVYLAREETNIEQNWEGSYFYNNTNQFFNISVTDDSYTSYPNNTFTKEIQPQEIFSCDHAVDSYLITPLSKETKALVHTGAQKKTETTNTTGTITNKTTQKVNTEKTEKTPNNTQKDTTPTVKKEEKSEGIQDHSTAKILAPNEVYRDEYFGIQIKNKGRYPGTIVINKLTDKNNNGSFVFKNNDNSYLINFYVSVPDKIGQFQLLESVSKTAKQLGKDLEQTGKNIVLIKQACISKENCYDPIDSFHESNTPQLNHQGFILNYAGRAIDSIYEDKEIKNLKDNDTEITDEELKNLSKNRYSSRENYEQKVTKVMNIVADTFEINENYSFAKIKEENKEDPQQTVKQTEKGNTQPTTQKKQDSNTTTKNATETTSSNDSISKEGKSESSLTFYTKNLGLYPSSGLQLDEQGNLSDIKKTKAIMQKIGLCGVETRFDCNQGVRRFEKDKVGQLFIYSVGKRNWKSNCKGQERSKCYTPTSTTPFFKTKPSSKEGYVYLYPADTVKLCILGAGENEC